MRAYLLLLALLLAGCPVAGSDDDDSAADDDDADGWIELQDQLHIRDVFVGDGAEVQVGDTITAHYTLWLYEDDALGDMIETSTNGNPFTADIGVGDLIQGWDLGIPGMFVGGTRELIIGPDLAYGASGQGPVPGNATLFFQVEVLDAQ